MVNKQQIRVPNRDIIAGEQQMEDCHEDEKASYIYSKVTYKTDKMPTNTVKGSQFSQPLFEFTKYRA